MVENEILHTDIENHKTDDQETNQDRSGTLTIPLVHASQTLFYVLAAIIGLTPLLRALPEPTKRPAPMDPPIAIMCK